MKWKSVIVNFKNHQIVLSCRLSLLLGPQVTLEKLCYQVLCKPEKKNEKSVTEMSGQCRLSNCEEYIITLQTKVFFVLLWFGGLAGRTCWCFVFPHGRQLGSNFFFFGLLQEQLPGILLWTQNIGWDLWHLNNLHYRAVNSLIPGLQSNSSCFYKSANTHLHTVHNP